MGRHTGRMEGGKKHRKRANRKQVQNVNASMSSRLKIPLKAETLKQQAQGERKMGVKALCTKGKQNVAILSCQPVQPTSQSAKAEL